MVKRLFLALDWRSEARAVRRLLKKRDIQSLCEVHSRLLQCPHNYPHGLLELLVIEMPKMTPNIYNDEFTRLAADLLRTAEWEKHERDRQVIM